MSDNAIMIFTGKGLPSFARDGGTGNWHLNRDRAQQSEYVVICHHAGSPYRETTHQHRQGWLVGRVIGLRAVQERWVVQFSEYAEIDMPQLWDGSRNPVRYTTLTEIGIDPTSLDWKPMPAPEALPALEDGETPDAQNLGVFIRQVLMNARLSVAESLGISVDQVQVSIKNG